MTYKFNVDRFYAQMGAFSIFVHAHDRGMKPRSNWISWPVSLMLADFSPNWAFFLFSLFHMKEGSKSQKSGRVCVILMTLRCLVLPFFCHSFQLITSTCRNRFWPYLVTTAPSSTATWSHNQHGVKGHVGVTGVKKVIFTKMLLLQILNYDHVTCTYEASSHRVF